MISQLTKIGVVITLPFSAFWLCEQKEWEPAILLVTSFLAVLYYLLREQRNHPDKALFELFLKELPFEGTIRFLKEHDFGQSFNIEPIDRLEDFDLGWEDALHEFRNKKLEKSKKELIGFINKFRETLALKVMPLDNGRYRIWLGCANSNDDSIRREGEEKLRLEIEELNAMADKIVESHQKLVRLGMALIQNLNIIEQETLSND